jgi:acetaldehyde dehydrogenase (acetylating)
VTRSSRIRVAIVGTGKIASDLAARVLASEDMVLAAVAGRSRQSEGLGRLSRLAEFSTWNGLDGLAEVRDSFDGVFDATSAFDHPSHWETIKRWGKWVVDLTPSRVGKPTVPVLGRIYPRFGAETSFVANYSMVTCGGQSGSPIAAALCGNALQVSSIEVSSSISSDSAGPATRRNVDDYVLTTEALMAEISGGKPAKAILVLNPAEPPPLMRTTVTVSGSGFDVPKVEADLEAMVADVRRYVPGYSVVVPPHSPEPGVISATATVEGEGYFLPRHAGNLDIINAASIEVARQHMEKTGS